MKDFLFRPEQARIPLSLSRGIFLGIEVDDALAISEQVEL
jgi:hypothetical protein